jgi:hypothetical protein
MNAARIAFALLVATVAVQTASAQQPYQPPAGFYRPPVSPFVNLGLGGVNPGIAYYGIVRPTEQLYNLEQQVGQQQQLAAAGNAARVGGLPQTGTSARFMSYSSYFNNVGGVRIGAPVPPPGYSAPVPLGGQGAHR